MSVGGRDASCRLTLGQPLASRKRAFLLEKGGKPCLSRRLRTRQVDMQRFQAGWRWGPKLPWPRLVCIRSQSRSTSRKRRTRENRHKRGRSLVRLMPVTMAELATALRSDGMIRAVGSGAWMVRGAFLQSYRVPPTDQGISSSRTLRFPALELARSRPHPLERPGGAAVVLKSLTPG